MNPRSEEARSLSEAKWDEIICANVTALADALRAAGVLAEGHTLRVLGCQIDNVDVLLAEVPLNGDDEADLTNYSDDAPRRVVLLEDKLVRNPEAKRQVLAQLLDYSLQAQIEWNVDLLCRKQKLDKSTREWLRSHEGLIDGILARGEFLLIIAGDGIDENLLRLARRFVDTASPLSLAELCLVAMAVYRRGEERLFIPHVVSAVERHQRQLSIRVTVQTEKGAVLPASVERDLAAEARVARRGALPVNPDVQRFLSEAKAILDAKCSEMDRRMRETKSRENPCVTGLMMKEHG